jgi:hypothetical protein
MHLTEEELQRLLHGEAAPDPVRAHAEQCSECAGRLEQERAKEADLFALLDTVDHPPPMVTAHDIAARARPPRRRLASSPVRWAATIVLVVGLAGIAYAVPGSPVRTWLEDVFHSDAESDGTLVTPAFDDGPAGIAIDPGALLVIVFETVRTGSRARVTLVETPRVMVEAPSGSAGFTIGPDRLQVAIGRDSTLVEVRVPRSLPRLEIYQGNRLLLSRTAAGVVVPPSAGDSVYLLPLGP